MYGTCALRHCNNERKGEDEKKDKCEQNSEDGKQGNVELECENTGMKKALGRVRVQAFICALRWNAYVSLLCGGADGVVSIDRSEGEVELDEMRSIHKVCTLY